MSARTPIALAITNNAIAGQPIRTLAWWHCARGVPADLAHVFDNDFGKRLWQENTETTTYVQIKAGTYRRGVEIYPPAVELRDPQLSVLLVLGLYNMIWEPDTGKPTGMRVYTGQFEDRG